MHHYCTYFDARFLARGLALHASLCRHARPFVLHVLCLDDAARAALAALKLPDVRPIGLAELEAADPELRAARSNRSLVEYYFTCTPALPLYLLDRHGPDAITYLDADLYFFAAPDPIFDALGSGSVLIISHRYPPALRHFERYGRYNVGLLTFRNTPQGRRCLRWWHDRCIAWCYDRVEPHRYADQKYLDDWPTRFAGVVDLAHRGANLAPWNLAASPIAWRDGRVWVDDDPLVFYHFHRLKPLQRHLYDPGLRQYGAPSLPVVHRHIYGPYLRELRHVSRRAGCATGSSLRLAGPSGGRELLRTLLYDRTLLSVGSLAAEVHLEPIARPLLHLWHGGRRAA